MKKLMACWLLLCTAAISQVVMTAKLQYTWSATNVSSTGPLGSIIIFNGLNVQRPNVYSIQWGLSGTVPSACTFGLQGSNDTVNWFALDAGNVSCTSSSAESISGQPFLAIRVNLATWTPGDSTTVVKFNYVGSPGNASITTGNNTWSGQQTFNSGSQPQIYVNPPIGAYNGQIVINNPTGTSQTANYGISFGGTSYYRMGQIAGSTDWVLQDDSGFSVIDAPHGGKQAKTYPLVAAGTKFTTSGCSVSATTGGAWAGKMTLGANTCTVVITLNGATGVTAPNGWTCGENDETTAAGNTGLYESGSTATTASLVVPATAGTTDVIDFSCAAY
jgi:hypothetical protein